MNQAIASPMTSVSALPALTGIPASQTCATERAACRRAGLSVHYLELIRAVQANPLSGAYGVRFERILERAQRLGVIQRVFGGSETRQHGSSVGNAWHELGELGEQIMRDIAEGSPCQA